MMFVFLVILAVLLFACLTLGGLLVLSVSTEAVPWSRRGVGGGALLILAAVAVLAATIAVAQNHDRESVEKKAQACLDKGGTPLTIGRGRDDVACVYGKDGRHDTE